MASEFVPENSAIETRNKIKNFNIFSLVQLILMSAGAFFLIKSFMGIYKKAKSSETEFEHK